MTADEPISRRRRPRRTRAARRAAATPPEENSVLPNVAIAAAILGCGLAGSIIFIGSLLITAKLLG